MDSRIGLVKKLLKIKVPRPKDGKPKDFTDELVHTLGETQLKAFDTYIERTSSARADKEKMKPDDKKLLHCLDKLPKTCKNIFVNTISQEGQAKFSEMSLNHILLFASPDLKNQGLVPSKVIQLEADEWSTQSAAFLPKQTEGEGANWAEELLDKGKSLKDIGNLYGHEQIKQFVDKSKLMGKDKIGLQGLFAAAMEGKDWDDRKLLEGMGIDTDDKINKWNRGQILIDLEKVIQFLCEQASKADVFYQQSESRALGDEKVQQIISTVSRHPKITELLPIKEIEEAESKEESSKNNNVEILKIIVKNLKEIPKKRNKTEVQYEPTRNSRRSSYGRSGI